MSAPLVIVAAIARNRVIGRDNGLAWRLSSDLKHFRALTLGKPMIMGRKTFASIGRPLPGRQTIVLTRDLAAIIPGVLIVHDLETGIALAQTAAQSMQASEIIIAGGAEIYAQTIMRATCLHITEVDLAPPGDALFPVINPALWAEVSRQVQPRTPTDEAAFSFVTYYRR